MDDERLRLLGILSGGIVHDIANPLNAILMNAELGLMYLEKGPNTESLTQLLKAIAGEARRSGSVLRGLMDFARAEGFAPSGVEGINDSVTKAQRWLRSVLRRQSIEITLTLDDFIPKIPLNSNALSLGIVSLVYRLLDAQPRRLHITTKRDRDHVTVELECDGDRALLAPHLSHPDVQLVQRIVEEQAGQLFFSEDAATGPQWIMRFPIAAHDMTRSSSAMPAP